MTTDTWITTFTGREVNPLKPNPATICIEDIAHGLSLNCRYNGQCRVHYSVAQHSILVMTLLQASIHPIYALLHDAAEAYLPDITSPLKQGMPGFAGIEATMMAAIYEGLGITPPTEDEERVVKVADRMALLIEYPALLPAGARMWVGMEGIARPDRSRKLAEIFDAPTAEQVFLEQFRLATEYRGS